jgi:hypothetical protein
MIAFSSNLLAGTGLPRTKEELHKRGLNIYTMSEVVGVVGRDKWGEIQSGTIEVPLFGLSIYDRLAIAQRCDSVYGVVTGRANRIAGLEWSVTKESKEEDRIELYLKSCKQVFDEYSSQISAKTIIVRGKMIQNMTRYLPDMLPDASNFSGAMLRWRRRINMKNDDASTQIEDWLHEPNAEDDFEDFLKKWVSDLMVHGADAIYKEYVDGRLENMYHLPGGSVIPLRDRYVSAKRMFVQAMPGMDPKMYFADEITFSSYFPQSGIGYGLIPLEALVNKVAETLFFDQRAAEMADGTVPPEKVALFGEQMPFGDLTGEEALNVPLSEHEQTRLEVLLNEPRKDAIRVLSGVGTPQILDLSRADTFQYQSQRQKDIRESCAFVYNMSNMEINATGSDGTSGRETSESQADIEKQKGIYPIVKIIQNKMNREHIPLRWGSGYVFEFQSGLSPEQQVELDTKMMQSQTYGANEIRVKRGDEPWGPEFDQPQAGQQAGAADGSQAAPFNMRQM